jgi:hypothetical protein
VQGWILLRRSNRALRHEQRTPLHGGRLRPQAGGNNEYDGLQERFHTNGNGARREIGASAAVDNPPWMFHSPCAAGCHGRAAGRDHPSYIRCETRLAIQDKAIELLLAFRNGEYQPSIDLANTLKAKRGKAWNFDPRMLTTQDERAFYFRYIQTGIAYDFTLDITEENRGTLLADPVRRITNGAAGIGLDASGDFSRNNARRFIMSDTFAKLLDDQNLRCDTDRPENFVYPIAGRIGLRELISTFVDLNEKKPGKFKSLRRHHDIHDDVDRIGEPACRDCTSGKPMGFGKPDQLDCLWTKDRQAHGDYRPVDGCSQRGGHCTCASVFRRGRKIGIAEEQSWFPSGTKRA